MRTHSPLTAVVVLAVLAIGATACDQFTAEGRRKRMLERLQRQDILVRRSCGLGEAHVDARKWQALSADDQQRAAEAIASYCAAQEGESTVTVFDAMTREKLARWNGTALER